MAVNVNPSELRLAVADYWANMAKIMWKQNLKLIGFQFGVLSKFSQRT